MKSLTNIMMAIMMLSTTVSTAQSKKMTTENVKISGNCGMCKSTIEKAGNLKNVASVDWNKDTKMATIQYDASQTDKNEILKRIALAGYDNESFLAPDDTYSGLPGCCQYERAMQKDAMEKSSQKEDHSDHKNMKMGQEANPLQVIYNGYFALKDALVATNGNTASTEAKKLAAAIGLIKMETLTEDEHVVWMKVQKDLLSGAQKIESSKDPAKQRDQFILLSENMYQLMKVSKVESPIYYQHCPMANNGKGANWLSKENVVKNPYYGSQMMSCGKVVETIN